MLAWKIPPRDFIMEISYIHVSHKTMEDPYIAEKMHMDHILIYACETDIN